MRRLMLSAAVAGLLATTTAGVALAGGPPVSAFYVDGSLYRTIFTPTDLSGTGAPASTFDVIYPLGGVLSPVADSKPGDRDYNGGRWIVLPVTWAAHAVPHQLYSAEEVLAAELAGDLTIADDPVAQFVCPVIPMRGNA